MDATRDETKKMLLLADVGWPSFGDRLCSELLALSFTVPSLVVQVSSTFCCDLSGWFYSSQRRCCRDVLWAM